MGKTAFIFPGQGSQYIGMGKDFFEADKTSRAVFELSGRVTGMDIEALCFEENDRLNITEYTQIAMVTVEIAILRALQERGIRHQVSGGLSLGEYGALAACGVMTDEDIFKTVRLRGKYMQEAVPTGGAMAAILGLSAEAIEEVLKKAEGAVSIANYNCPGQIVITGEENAVLAASEKCKEAGAKRAVMLKVSGPFHSPLLGGAGEKLGEALAGVQIRDFSIPYVANVTADYVREKDEVKPLLIRQVSSPVRWQQSVAKMIADGTDTFIEMGPGKTLAGFMRKIDKEATVFNIDKYEDLEKCLEGLKEKGLC